MDEIKNKKILIVDDEKELLKLLENKLFESGFYHIFKSENCRNALQIAKEQNIALFVLDVNLPDGNGFALYEDIRKFSQSPVIFLTARGEADDRLTGLGLGADDYITKPFGMMEFIARVRAVLRRAGKEEKENDVLETGDLQIQVKQHQVLAKGEKVTLTLKEFELLKFLMENKGIVLTRDRLLGHVWGYDFDGETRTVDVHVRTLRQKLGECGELIETVRGVGYRIGG